MATARQSAANRLNARRSTGPRTPAGKHRSTANALAHGLRVLSPVLAGEDPADWLAFHAAVLADLRPVGAPEAELATRIAGLMWRLRRIVAFEVANAAGPADPARFDFLDPTTRKQRKAALEDARLALTNGRRRQALVAVLADAADVDPLPAGDALFVLGNAATAAWLARPPRPVTFEAVAGGTDEDPIPDVGSEEFLAAAGVPQEWREAADTWDGWSVGLVRAGLRILAGVCGRSAERLLADVGDVDVAALEKKVLAATAEVDRLADAELGRVAVPSGPALEAIMRYEPHLSRQLTQALDQLERVRALRRG